MLSIVSGTLNRRNLLPLIVDNTVFSHPGIELILVDGGSTDGSIEYIRQLNHPSIKLIEVGKRSSYPHFMNLGIMHSSHELICQWNDDVILLNQWDDVFIQIDNSDFYLFNWKYGDLADINDPEWLKGNDHSNHWFLMNNKSDSVQSSIVMNFGIYKKEIFRQIGLYNPEYKYYYADADMSERAWYFGYKVKNLREIKVCSLNVEKRARHYPEDYTIFEKNLNYYRRKKIPASLSFLE